MTEQQIEQDNTEEKQIQPFVTHTVDEKHIDPNPSIMRIHELIREHKAAQEAKVAYVEANKDVLDMKAELTTAATTAENILKATAAQYGVDIHAVDPYDTKDDTRKEAPMVPGVKFNAAKTVLVEDESALRTWVFANAPYLLEVKRGAFEDMIKAHYGKSTKSLIPPADLPAIVVRATQPTIATNLEKALGLYEEKDQAGLFKELDVLALEDAITWLKEFSPGLLGAYREYRPADTFEQTPDELKPADDNKIDGVPF